MWPPAFPDFFLRDPAMPLLCGAEAQVKNAADKERDLELGFDKVGAGIGECVRVTGDGQEEEKTGVGSPAALEVEPSHHVPPAFESLSAPFPTASTSGPCLHHINSISSKNTIRSSSAGISSFASSVTTLMDKHGIIATTGLPPKRFDRFIRNARYTFLSVYRRLYLLVLLPNIVTMIVLGALNKPGIFDLPVPLLATAATANILLGVLMRQELVINALFIIFGHCPQWFPLIIRRMSAKIYHLGGVHSGAGVAATVWFGVTTVAIFSLDETVVSGGMRLAIWIITATLDVLLLSILVLAMPTFRRRWHDYWEWSHRFCGWAAIGLFWALFILLSMAFKRTVQPEPPTWRVITASPIFWMLIIITCCLIAPWLNLRKVPVTVERLSNHVVRLHFTYSTPPLCSAPRLTDKPLREWHAFASIPEDSGKGFSVLVSAAGDWTRAAINDPPAYLWKRGWLTRGVLNVAPIFKSMIIVATGSGIGPVLSLLKGKRKLGGVRILWSTKDPSLYYGQAIIDDVYAVDPSAVVINTTILKRPNLLELAHNMYVDSQAEAVFVISNPRVTRKTVYGLESRGVPCFAPIFDS